MTTLERRPYVPMPTPIGELHQASWNPRSITPARLDSLCRSLEADPDLLWLRPILAMADGTIYAGNQRFAAAVALGWETVPAVVEDASDQLARERALRDNNAAGEWVEDDRDALLTELLAQGSDLSALAFDPAELETMLAGNAQPSPIADVEPQVDRAAELQARYGTASGQLWRFGGHRLLIGDSTNTEDLARLMAGDRADLLWTDPPYGVNYAGRGGDAIAGDVTYTAIPLFFSHLEQLLARRAWLYVCGGSNNMSLYSRMFERYLRMTPRVIVWDKGSTVMRHSGYHAAYEFVYYGYTEGAGSDWYFDRGGDGTGDIWRVARPSSAGRNHLTEKPLELPLWAIRNTCPSGGLVLDTFAGSGGVFLAAEQLGRRSAGVEIDPGYAAVILQRMLDVGLRPELVDELCREA